MTRGEQLISVGNDLVDYIVTLGGETGIETVIKLHGGDLNTLPANAFGVFLSVPSPTTEQRLVHGENAVHLWRYSVIISVQSVTHEEGLVRALDALAAVRRGIAHPVNGFSGLVPAMPFYEIYDNSASNTVMAIEYEYNWKI